MDKLRFLGILCVIAGLAVFSPAQTANENGVAVHTVVTVEPHKNANNPVVNREDVLVYEGHEKDMVTDWTPATGDHAALEFFILIDDGSSFSLDRQLNDLKQFIENQPATAKIGVAYMQNGTARVAQELTTDHEAAAKALRMPLGIEGVNGSPYFSISDLIKRWPASSARREVLVVSDGIDRYYGSNDLNDPYLDAATSDAQRAGILISAIYNPGNGHFAHSYWESYWGQMYLASIAQKTGGEAYYIGMTGSPVAFTPFLDNVAARLGRQYLLTFMAKVPKKPGLQRVRITTEVPKVDLVAPEEFMVGAQ